SELLEAEVTSHLPLGEISRSSDSWPVSITGSKEPGSVVHLRTSEEFDEKRQSPPGEKTAESTGRLCGSGHWTTAFCDGMSQMRTVPSFPDETKRRPSGENPRECTIPE